VIIVVLVCGNWLCLCVGNPIENGFLAFGRFDLENVDPNAGERLAFQIDDPAAYWLVVGQLQSDGRLFGNLLIGNPGRAHPGRERTDVPHIDTLTLTRLRSS